MPIHFDRFDRETNKLSQIILSLSAIVQNNLEEAIRSLEAGDPKLAREVIESDRRVDQMEVDVEEECLKILALYQPVAGDLRLVVSLLKSNNDLERIGDLSRDIANSVLSLRDRPAVVLEFDWKGMTERVRWIVKNSLESLINLDVKLAYEVGKAEEEIDGMHETACARIRETLEHESNHAESLLALWTIAAHLENIADHAKKIAEGVIYNVSGKIVRHKQL